MLIMRKRKTEQPDTVERIVSELFRLGIDKFKSDRQFALAANIDRSTLKYLKANPASCDLGKLVSIAAALEFDDIFHMMREVRLELGRPSE